MNRRITVNAQLIYINVEEQFWDCLQDIAEDRGLTLSDLVSFAAREYGGEIESAVRVYVLAHYQAETRPEHAVTRPH